MAKVAVAIYKPREKLYAKIVSDLHLSHPFPKFRHNKLTARYCEHFLMYEACLHIREYELFDYKTTRNYRDYDCRQSNLHLSISQLAAYSAFRELCILPY